MNELLWAGGTAAGIAILGRLGTSIVAANSITSVVGQLAMVFAFGPCKIQQQLWLEKRLVKKRFSYSRNLCKETINLFISFKFGGSCFVLCKTLYYKKVCFKSLK